MKIFPAITTIFDWRSKVQEVKNLGLKEVSVFLTCLKISEVHEFFSLLKGTKVERIPFVHIRSDNTQEQLDYLIENYHTEALNIHTKKEFAYSKDYKKYKKMIYIENTYEPLDEKEIKEFSGICLDFSHLESARLFQPDLYKHNVKLIEKYGCGCNHISPAKNFSLLTKKEVIYPLSKHPHFLTNMNELDYLKNYPSKYFSKFIALEMENTIKEQLEAKDYILELLGKVE